MIFNLFNGNAFLNIVILYYLLMRRDVWFANHLVNVLLSLKEVKFVFKFFKFFGDEPQLGGTSLGPKMGTSVGWGGGLGLSPQGKKPCGVTFNYDFLQFSIDLWPESVTKRSQIGPSDCIQISETCELQGHCPWTPPGALRRAPGPHADLCYALTF